MHEIWTIPTTNMMYTRSQNYTNMVIGEYVIQTLEVVIVLLISLLSFNIFVLTKLHIPYYFLTSGLSKCT